MTTNQPRSQVTQRTGAEPQAHHLAAHSLRRQQGHGRQTNRTQAQFPERQHQDTAHQPERRNPCPTVAQHVLRRQHHQAKARRRAQNADHELGDAARTNVFARQLRPCPAKYRGQQNDEQGIDRLEPHRRDLKITDHAVSVVVGEQVEGGWLLLERGPEERGGDQQNKAHQQPCALFAIQPGEDEQIDEVERDGGGNHIHQHAGDRDRINHNHALGNQRYDDCNTHSQRQQPGTHAVTFHYRTVPGGVQTDFTVVALHGRNGKHAEDNQGDQHPDTTDTKAPVPAVGFDQPAGNQRGNERAHVDAHIEQRETAVTTRIAFFIQGADHDRDTGLEQAGAEHDKHQADEEQVVAHDGRQGDRQVPERNQNRTVPDGPLLAEPVIRQPAARQRSEVHGAGKDADNRRGVFTRQAHSAVIDGGGHKQNQ